MEMNAQASWNTELTAALVRKSQLVDAAARSDRE